MGLSWTRVFLSLLLATRAAAFVQDLESQLDCISAYFNGSANPLPKKISTFTAEQKSANTTTGTKVESWMLSPMKVPGFSSGESPFSIAQMLSTSPSARATQTVLLSPDSRSLSLFSSAGGSEFEAFTVQVGYVSASVATVPQTKSAVKVSCTTEKGCVETEVSVARGLGFGLVWVGVAIHCAGWQCSWVVRWVGLRRDEVQAVNVTSVLQGLRVAVDTIKGGKMAEITEGATCWPSVVRLWRDYFMLRSNFGVIRAELTFLRNLNFADVLPALANLTHGEDDVSWYRKNFEYNIDVNKRFRMVFIMEKQAKGLIVLEIGKETKLFDLSVGVFYTEAVGESISGPPSKLPSSYNAVVGTNMGVTNWEVQYHREDFWPKISLPNSIYLLDSNYLAGQ